jgi:hypothetical protein
MNYAQRMWLAYNQVEDMRNQEHAVWQHAKFIASAHNPKGVRLVELKEKNRNQQENHRRQDVLDRFYYKSIGVLDEEDRLVDGRPIAKASKSVEELADEFHRWVKGDQDEHDRIVEGYKRAILERHHQVKEERAQLLLEMQESPQVVEAPEMTKMVGYDAAQLAEMLQSRSGPGPDHKVRTVFDDDQAARREYVVNEHLEKAPMPPPPGGFELTEKGIQVPGAPPPKTLQEKVGQRRQVLSETPEVQ